MPTTSDVPDWVRAARWAEGRGPHIIRGRSWIEGLPPHHKLHYWRWMRRHARARLWLRRWVPWVDDRRHAWRLAYWMAD